MSLQNKLTVVLTTHILPTAPSTHVIESCISSIKKHFKSVDVCNFLVYCDMKDPSQTITQQYIQNLEQIKDITVILSPQSGLKTNYLRAIDSLWTPFMLFVEHDWIFLRDINTKLLIDTMSQNDNINFVRFNKRDNNKPHIDNPEPGDADFWETYIEAEDKYNQPLVKTNCIATHPHIIRVDSFQDRWRKHLNTFSIEWDVYQAYNKDIDAYGFEKAHKDWGIYNYGSIADKKIIDHLDGSNHYTHILK